MALMAALLLVSVLAVAVADDPGDHHDGHDRAVGDLHPL